MPRVELVSQVGRKIGDAILIGLWFFPARMVAGGIGDILPGDAA
jgi:hypothetical protein